MTVYEALNAVMIDVPAVKKDDRNKQQDYLFRGIDAVVLAVGPMLRKHRVIIVPMAEDITSEHFSTRSGAQMRSVTVRVRWRIFGPDGDHLDAVTYGEAADAGDKAVSKAHSVAYRTVLLQALCIPTDDPDPDAQTYERGGALVNPELDAARTSFRGAWEVHFGGWNQAEADDWYSQRTKVKLFDAAPADLRKAAAYLANLPHETAGSDPATQTDGGANPPRPGDSGSPSAAAGAPPSDPPETETSERMMTKLQRAKIYATLGDLGIRDAAEQRTKLGEIIGRPLKSGRDLTLSEAKQIIDALENEGVAVSRMDSIPPLAADPSNPFSVVNDPAPQEES